MSNRSVRNDNKFYLAVHKLFARLGRSPRGLVDRFREIQFNSIHWFVTDVPVTIRKHWENSKSTSRSESRTKLDSSVIA